MPFASSPAGRTIAAAMLTAAATLTSTASPAVAAVSAAPAPTYTCAALVVLENQEVEGTAGCQGSNGAVTSGPYRGESIIRTTSGLLQFKCLRGGIASLPAAVTGIACAPLQ